MDNETKTVDPMRKLEARTAYRYDPITGWYQGTETAWESPLEPGVFHLPANTTAVPPPATYTDQISVWHQDKWNVLRKPGPVLVGS